MTEGDARRLVNEIAEIQKKVYHLRPEDLRKDYGREQSALSAYRGRQLLELLQNADDAGESAEHDCALRFELTRKHFVVANTGAPFSDAGVKSLVISDTSPKLFDRNRFIGCKGLGFRSVLTWSSCPLVASGPHLVAFDREHARQEVGRLASESAAILREVTAYREALKHDPAPVMSFPFVPGEGDELSIAERLRQDFATVIVLRLPEGPWGDAVHEDIRGQLDALGERMLIFCRHVTHLHIAGDLSRDWRLLRQARGKGLQDVVVSRDGDGVLWTVHRPPPGRVEPSPDQRAATREEYELAIAVPQRPHSAPDATLCVFFPTKEEVPCSLAFHATLDTTDDRNRIEPSTTNAAVLTRLAECAANILAAEARSSDAGNRWRALSLIAGIERNGGPLGFSRKLLERCQEVPLFPRRDGAWATANDARLAPHSVWLEDDLAESFPEMLEVRGVDEATRGLLRHFCLGWFDKATTRARLERYVTRVLPERAGVVIAKLYEAQQLRGISPSTLLVGIDGDRLDGTGATFFAPTSDLPPLPGWVVGVRFVHPDFQAGLAQSTSLSAVRALAARVQSWGGKIDEYRFDTVARALVDETACATVDADKLARWRDVLAWIYAVWRASAQRVDELPVRLLTTRGELVAAKQAYLGPAYARAQLVVRLYGNLQTTRLVASPAELGLPTSADESHHVADFLEALGASSTPRAVPVLDDNAKRLAEGVLANLDFPRALRGRVFETRADFDLLARAWTVTGAGAIDRMREVAIAGDTTALVAYLLSPAGASAIADVVDENACLALRFTREHDLYPDQTVPIPNVTRHILTNEAWVPAVDGSRKRPSDIVFGRHASVVLRGFYVPHAIDVTAPEVVRAGGARAVRNLLERLGALSSLETLDAERLYPILLRLPKRDPSGETATSLYAALLDAQVDPEDTEAKHTFVRDGKMWGAHGNVRGYIPVTKLKYDASGNLPALLRPLFHLVDIPTRKNSGDVRRLFGIPTLNAGDIPVQLEHEGTTFDDESEALHAHFRRARIFIYALRVATTSRATREAAPLADARLRLCSTARVRINLPDGTTTVQELAPGDRVVVGDELVVVVSDPRPSSIELWCSVAALVSERMGVASGAAEVGNVLRCEDEVEMDAVVRGLLGNGADAALSAARKRFANDALQREPIVFPLPRPAGEADEEEENPASEATLESDDATSNNGSDNAGAAATGDDSVPDADEVTANGAAAGTEFSPINGPAPGGQRAKRKLVVTGKTRPPKHRGPVATEAETLDVADAYERAQGRFPINVDHVRGRDAFGCDRISVKSEEIRRRALADGFIAETEIERFIEVKGSTSRTRALELTENEHQRAKLFTKRYFIYRVFVPRDSSGRYELATLQDPTSSKATFRVTRFDLAEGSGAEWFAFETRTEEEGEVAETERGEEVTPSVEEVPTAS